MDQETYLNERLDDQLTWFDKNSQWNQKWFKHLQVAQLVSAALIPFVSGFMDAGLVIKIVVGLLGVIVASITGIITLYKFHDNWVAYRSTCEALRVEKILFLTKSAPYNKDEPFTLLVERVEAILLRENANWQDYIKTNTK
ncbi:DUF4231 domain-containing protein [candidate division KSB1 bacterium]|nr:DUF4231 domain-containing protein [candidate division KSB1 bacterium]